MLFPFIIYLGALSMSNCVEAMEERIIESNDIELNLCSFTSHNDFSQSLEHILRENITSGLVYFGEQYKSNVNILLKELDKRRYTMLQILHGLISGDEVYTKLILKLAEDLTMRDISMIFNWFAENFIFKIPDLVPLVRNYVHWNISSLFRSPEAIDRFMIKLVGRYSLARELAVGNDRVVLNWLVRNGFDTEIFENDIILLFLLESNFEPALKYVYHMEPKELRMFVESYLNSTANLGIDLNANEVLLGRQMLLYKSLENNNPIVTNLLLKAGIKVDMLGRCNTTLLIKAASENNLDIVKKLLPLGSNAYAKDCHGKTPMHFAVDNDNYDMIVQLIESGFDVNFRLEDGGTILHYAVSNGTYRSVDTLTHLGAIVDIIDNNDVTPLLKAVLLKKSYIIGLLISKGAQTNLKYSNGDSYLHKIIEKGNIMALVQLLKFPVVIDALNDNKETPLAMAIKIDSPAIVNALIKNGADINKTVGGLTYLHMAILSNSIKSLRALLENKLKINVKDSQGVTPEILAVKRDDVEALGVLKDFGANIKEKIQPGNKTLLHLAAEFDNRRVAGWLIDNGISVDVMDADHWTPLHYAARHGSTRVARELLGHNAKTELKNSDGETPLHKAVGWGSLGVVMSLLEHKADIHARTPIENPPLNLASFNGQNHVVKALLEAGANVELKNFLGNTALHDASGRGKTETINILLDFKADINSKNHDGFTALHLAADAGHLNVVKALVLRGALVNSRGNNGKTPLYLAEKRGHDEIVSYLRSVGGV